MARGHPTFEKADTFMSMSYARKTLSPIGFRKDESPIWSVFGAEGEGDDGGGGSEGGGDGDPDDDADPEGEDGELGDAGKAAVERERKAADRLRRSLKPFAQLRKETGMTVEEMRERLLDKKPGSGKSKDDGGGQQIDADEIRREARREVQAKSDQRYLKMALKAEAASILADPDDAARFLDLSSYEVDDDGEVDSRLIKRDLAALVADRPYLGKVKKAPDYEGGPRGSKAPKDAGMNAFIRNRAGYTD
jgi:hypothetical protein